VRHQEQNGGTCQVLNECGEPFFRAGVDPMEILDGKDQRLVPAVVQQEVPQEYKEPHLTLLRVKARQARIVHGHIEQLEEQGDVILWSKVGLLIYRRGMTVYRFPNNGSFSLTEPLFCRGNARLQH
jgi:hypothetical protein